MESFQNVEKSCIYIIYHYNAVDIYNTFLPSEIQLFKCTLYTGKSTGWMNIGTHYKSWGNRHFHISWRTENILGMRCVLIFILGTTILRIVICFLLAAKWECFSDELKIFLCTFDTRGWNVIPIFVCFLEGGGGGTKLSVMYIDLCIK